MANRIKLGIAVALHVKQDRGDDLVVISRETWGELIRGKAVKA